jgi:hypothetical protein
MDIRDLMSRSDPSPGTDDSITLSGLSAAARAIGPPVLLARPAQAMSPGSKIGVIAIVVAAVVLVGASAGLLLARSRSGSSSGAANAEQMLALMTADVEPTLAPGPPAEPASSAPAIVEPTEEAAQPVGKSKRSRPRKSGSSKAATPAPAPAKSKNVSELDDLLGGAPAGSTKKAKSRKKKKAAAPENVDTKLPKSLTRAQVQSGLKRVAPKVKSCGKRSSGILMMRVAIGKNGRVSMAQPTGALAGSKTGKCAARAVRRARFPKFSGSRITVMYPYRL